MTTIVNAPQPAQPVESGNNGLGFLLGVILLIVFVALLFIYGLPYLRSSFQGPSLSVPSNVNVHVSK